MSTKLRLPPGSDKELVEKAVRIALERCADLNSAGREETLLDRYVDPAVAQEHGRANITSAQMRVLHIDFGLDPPQEGNSLVQTWDADFERECREAAFAFAYEWLRKATRRRHCDYPHTRMPKEEEGES